MTVPDGCVYCETCGDCLTCEPGCWCTRADRIDAVPAHAADEDEDEDAR